MNSTLQDEILVALQALGSGKHSAPAILAKLNENRSEELFEVNIISTLGTLCTGKDSAVEMERPRKGRAVYFLVNK